MGITVGAARAPHETPEREIPLGGAAVRFRASSEEYPVLREDGAEIAWARVFCYVRADAAGADARPVLFAFNGGPGSSSVWLHLGCLGPYRVGGLGSLDPSPVPPYRLEDNPNSLLDVCDLVFIDPVGTGYSRLLDPGAKGELYGVRQDARFFAALIHAWLHRHGRMNSPRFLAGESYGAIRACLLPGELMGGPTFANRRLASIGVSGVVLLGPSLGLPGADAPVYPELLRLPAQAAVNHFHHPEGKPGVREFVRQAWEFCGGDYLRALFAGDALAPGEADRVSRQLERFTGLPAQWYRARGLKAGEREFREAVLEAEGLDVGAYDGRYTMAHAAGRQNQDPVADDPAMGRYTPAFTAGMALLARDLLGLAPQGEYAAIDFSVNAAWDYACGEQPGEALAAAMRRNGRLAVFAACGLYDLVTPPGMARYLASHLGLPVGRLTVAEYESGHMPYLGEESAAALAGDLRRFVTHAAAAPEAKG